MPERKSVFMRPRNPSALGGFGAIAAKNAAGTKFPRLKSLLQGTNITRGVGPNFAETFRADEPGAPGNPNPHFGQDTIEIRDRGASGEVPVGSLVAGEALHLLPSRDKKFAQLRGQLASSLSPREVSILNRFHQMSVESRGETRSFQKWLDVSGLDEVIRAAVLPELGGDTTEKSGFFSPESLKVIQQIKKHLSGDGGK